MGRAVRLLFICLLAMALPLKGGAAVAMGGCSPVHSSMDIAAGEHDHPSASAELSTAHADIVEQGGDQATPKCSLCASCCSAAAPGFVVPSIVRPDTVRSTAVDQVRVQVGTAVEVPHPPPEVATL